LAWPPDAAALYLDAPPERPIFQGDVFEDVPFVKAKGGNNEPNIDVTRRHVATVLYPCDMYVQQGRVLSRVQVVALVKEAEGIEIPEDWDGAFSICPLPDLIQDGQMWMADFTRLVNIDRSFLRPENRVRSLSEYGWAFFRQRLALASSRSMIHLSDLQATGATTWQETAMESDWRKAGRSTEAFHDWLDDKEPELSGMSRRVALERGMQAAVQASLAAELSAA
jgi:hypothetical protein